MASTSTLLPPAAPDTTHALYVLLDSNLPTGGFVASSGLESYAKHGFLTPSRPYGVAGEPDVKGARGTPGRTYEWGSGTSSSSSSGSRAPQSAAPLGPSRAGPAVAQFADAEVENFEASTGWYLTQSWGVAMRALQPRSAAHDGKEEANGTANGNGEDDEAHGMTNGDNTSLEDTISRLVALDSAHEATLLSHVARRASRAQGVALLTLHARGLGPPPGFGADDFELGEEEREREERAQALVSEYKRSVRRGAPGHLAVCFGAVTAALGMDLATARHLYLFTHARSLLSSGVRLNIVGPYLSTQLLTHPLRKTISHALGSDAGLPPDAGSPGGDEWAWADEAEKGPATTWPLGEILAARHDLQHSRIFNS